MEEDNEDSDQEPQEQKPVLKLKIHSQCHVRFTHTERSVWHRERITSTLSGTSQESTGNHTATCYPCKVSDQASFTLRFCMK